MAQIEFNEEMGRALEVVYASRDVMRRRQLVREALAAQPGERLLDAGCGPGFYVAELAELVGDSGQVTGLDESSAMLGLARARSEGQGNVSFEQGVVTALPFADGSFDAAVCVQVLEYVAEVDVAIAELRRVLRPGGRLVIWDIDWGTVSWHTTDRARMDRVLGAWDQHLADPVLPRRLAPLLRRAGFEGVAMEAHVFATSEFTPDAYGAALVPIVKQYVAGAGRIPEEELDAWVAEQVELGERGEYYCAVTQVCFAARNPA